MKGNSTLSRGASCDRTRGIGHKLRYREFHLKRRQNVFTEQVSYRDCAISILGEVQTLARYSPATGGESRRIQNKGMKLSPGRSRSGRKVLLALSSFLTIFNKQ